MEINKQIYNAIKTYYKNCGKLPTDINIARENYTKLQEELKNRETTQEDRELNEIYENSNMTLRFNIYESEVIK